VTAAFAKNVPALVNTRPGTDFDTERFTYAVRGDAETKVVEIGLR
jgi:uncharacterized SAM-dependent methyltransferase